MIIHRNNLNTTRHGPMTEKALGPSQGAAGQISPLALPPAATGGSGCPGDIVYGAKAIARFIFDDDGNRARRRVFNLWSHYRDRKESAGFFKLKGALCLSKKRWQDFHGIG